MSGDDGLCSRCGHGRNWHRPPSTRGRVCTEWIPTGGGFLDGHYCRCGGYDVSVLPAANERLEFGRHRLNPIEAETAPAWPPLGEVQRRRDYQYRRELKRSEPA